MSSYIVNIASKEDSFTINEFKQYFKEQKFHSEAEFETRLKQRRLYEIKKFYSNSTHLMLEKMDADNDMEEIKNWIGEENAISLTEKILASFRKELLYIHIKLTRAVFGPYNCEKIWFKF